MGGRVKPRRCQTPPSTLPGLFRLFLQRLFPRLLLGERGIFTRFFLRFRIGSTFGGGGVRLSLEATPCNENHGSRQASIFLRATTFKDW